MKHGKLVRDKIPERIEAKGEFARERTFGELADVMEVLETVVPFHGFDRSVLLNGYASARTFTAEEFEDKDLEYDLLMDMDDLAAAFVARPTPESLAELVRRVWEVAAFQGMDRDDAEKARLAKRETHGAFEERIILDES